MTVVLGGTLVDSILRDTKNHSPSQYILDREDWQSRIIMLENEVKRLTALIDGSKKTGLDEFFEEI